ncbi:MAG: MBL fold metallo-hydrolase [Acidobacteria bacterium]|nr:MBL fold metallo-hydrolase [Acidobacteriota bacterium]
MIITKFVLSIFQQNSRVVACESTGRAIAIDPGADSAEMVDMIRDKGWQLQAVALTHGHLDHVGGTKFLKDAFPDAEVILHKDDEDLYYGLPLQPSMMGLPQVQLAALGLEYAEPPRLTRNWGHGEQYEVGKLVFDVYHCPGHTRGHVVLAEKNKKTVFVGDCLFAGSVGRSDLPGGDHEQLIDSINTNILGLGDDFVVYSGHGPETTVGDERRSNPFLNRSYMTSRGRYV